MAYEFSTAAARSFVAFLLTTSVLFIPSNTQPQKMDSSDYYKLCAPFKCGNMTFSFPFSPSESFGSGPYDCGLPRFQISCDSTTFLPGLELSGRVYRVKDLYQTERLITVVDRQLIDDLRSSSCKSLSNISISVNDGGGPSLQVPPWNTSFNFFKCAGGIAMSRRVVGNYSCEEGDFVYLWYDDRWNGSRSRPPDGANSVDTPRGCKLVTVPVFPASLSLYGFLKINSGGFQRPIKNALEVLSDGFPLEWPSLNECLTCQEAGGRCGYDGGSKRIICFCKDSCDPNAPKKSKWKLIAVIVSASDQAQLSVGVATGSTLIFLAVLLLIFKYQRVSYFCKNTATADARNAQLFIKDYQSMLLNSYSYREIKKMTKGFKEKLGRGGHGHVYKGKLPDGRLIAVKMLESDEDNRNNFINELATIGRIHHVNVISLLGFCLDNSKYALIYEFMPNGSLGDLLSKQEVNPFLGWARLLEIALGIAHGLEYLHSGCDSRILHLDIKPQNVLLDQNLDPKIADFGLAKIYSRNRSVVTMTGARGTIGYIAPEIFLRNLGKPSHKSDVYSFGMLLLEMAGGKKHFKPDMSSTSSSTAYFPGWLYDKLTDEKDLECIDVVVEEEGHVARKIIMVGLWCIQINPKDRPSMKKVIEMLSGNVEDIEMPPKSFIFSPPRGQIEQEITSMESFSSDIPFTSDNLDS